MAQIRPAKGDIQDNIERHKKFIDTALSGGAEMIVFPELAITGYEPSLAKGLATNKADERFDVFQNISDAGQITVAIGVPFKNSAGISISIILFQPQRERQIYSKKYLRSDEKPFFVCGQTSFGLIGGETRIALAVCYELAVPKHSADAFRSGAKTYIASAAKTADGVVKAERSLSETARKYSMTVMMANCLGRCDNFESAGKSAVWNDKGIMVGRLNETDEGLIIYDTARREIWQNQSGRFELCPHLGAGAGGF